MKPTFNEIKEAIMLLQSATDGMALVDFKSLPWMKSDGEVSWVEDGGLYSAEIHHYTEETDEYFFFEGDTQQGYYMSYFFDKSEELSPDLFEERYGDLY